MTTPIHLILTALWLLPIPLAYIGYEKYHANDPEARPVTIDELDPAYDFIVVGAGSAGT